VHDSGVGDHVAMRPVREDDLPVLEELTWGPETAGEFAQPEPPGPPGSADPTI
jgi:hypothetical protein